MRREENKQGKGRKDRREHENTQGGNFQGKYVCVSWRERLCCAERAGYSEDKEQAGLTIFFLGFLIGKSNSSAALYPTSLLLLCLSLFTRLSEWDVPVLLPSTACR